MHTHTPHAHNHIHTICIHTQHMCIIPCTELTNGDDFWEPVGVATAANLALPEMVRVMMRCDLLLWTLSRVLSDALCCIPQCTRDINSLLFLTTLWEEWMCVCVCVCVEWEGLQCGIRHWGTVVLHALWYGNRLLSVYICRRLCMERR